MKAREFSLSLGGEVRWKEQGKVKKDAIAAAAAPLVRQSADSGAAAGKRDYASLAVQDTWTARLPSLQPAGKEVCSRALALLTRLGRGVHMRRRTMCAPSPARLS
jgi:hypothetical protein